MPVRPRQKTLDKIKLSNQGGIELVSKDTENPVKDQVINYRLLTDNYDADFDTNTVLKFDNGLIWPYL